MFVWLSSSPSPADLYLTESPEPHEVYPDESPVNSYQSPSQSSPAPTRGQSLATELQQTSPNTHRQEQLLSSQDRDDEEGTIPIDKEGVWSGYQDTEGTSLSDEMMESTIITTPMRAEVEMLQREKELWREEQETLQETMREVRAGRDSVERWVCQWVWFNEVFIICTCI